jgi:aryl-alcohol dehydrogenase-like predicted oxidoreductase
MATLPLVILGTMNFGARTPAADAERIMARAAERGVIHFDTANAYADGESERLVGAFCRAHPAAGITVATKVGIGTLRGPAEGLAPGVVTRALEASLARLGMAGVAVCYLHKPDHGTPIAETLTALAEAQSRGLIVDWAMSNYGAWRSHAALLAAREVGLSPPVTNQLLYNVLVRDLEHEYFDFARAQGLSTTIYNPLAGGLLAGAHVPGAPPTGSRFDKNPMYRRRYWSERLFDVVAELREVAEQAGLDLLTLSYRWLLSAPGVDSVIVGPGTVQHLDAALDALGAGPLPNDVVKAVDAVQLIYRGTDARYAR